MAMPSMSTNGSPSMIMRSAKVPLSPSSALQTMYFWPGIRSCHRAPLDASGEPGSAAAPQPGADDLLDGGRRADGAGAGQAEQPAMGAVIVERDRVDDAAAGEGQPGLARQGTGWRPAHREGADARRHPAARRRRGRAHPPPPRGRRRCGRPAFCTSIIGSSQYRPRDPVRISSTPGSAARAWATASAPTASAPESRGTKTRVTARRPTWHRAGHG